MIRVSRTVTFICVHGMLDLDDSQRPPCGALLNLPFSTGIVGDEDSDVSDAVTEASRQHWTIDSSEYGYDSAVAFCPKHANCEQAQEDPETGYAKVWDLLDAVDEDTQWQCSCPPPVDPNQPTLPFEVTGEAANA